MALNRVARYVSSQAILAGNIFISHGKHEIWRAINSFPNAMTEKEKRFAKQRLKVIEDATADLVKLRARMQKTGRTL